MFHDALERFQPTHLRHLDVEGHDVGLKGCGLFDAVLAIHGDAEPRSPEASMVMMKANQYGYVAGLELPTDAASWRPMLLGLPALVVGAVACLLQLLLAAG